jgi:acetoin utilization protein AcuC
MTFAILYSRGLSEYDFGQGHPFRGDRYQIFRPFLQTNLPEDDNYKILEAEPASDKDLLLICGKEYVDFTREYYRAASAGLDYPGQFSRFHSGDNRPGGKPGKLEEAARLVVGQAKMACDLISQDKFRKVISIGGGLHHAKPDYGEGFCLYNDVAFCGRYLIQEYNLERILILDTDAHAGNGTSNYFYEEPKVLFIDLHQHPMTLYPGTGFADETGSGTGKGFTINIPMPVYAGYDSYQLVFESIVEPVVREFAPQIIIRNGGTDPHFADGLTALGLPLRGFRMIGEKVRKMAEVCDGRVIDLIASGYNMDVLPHGWLALISGLAGIKLDIEETEPTTQRPGAYSSLSATEKVIEEVRKQLKDCWDCLR